MASGRVNIEGVYASATKIGQEFQRVIEQHGQDVVSDLLPLVVEALEQLEQVVEEVTELHSENGKLSLEASRLQAETEARQNLAKEKKNLKELLTLKEKEIKEYKDKVDRLQITTDELTVKLRTQEMAVSEAGVEYKELQQQIKDCEKQLAEKDTLLKEKTKQVKQLKYREKGVKEDSDSRAQVQEDLARLEAKLETVQGKLEEKTKQSVEKDQKIKQLRKQLDEQKAKIGQEVTQLSTYQQKVGKLEKQLDDYTKQLEVMNRQQRRLDEKFKKSASENQSLHVKIVELEQQLESKNKQVGEKSKRIQELSKQLDEQIALNEQQNGGQHSVNKRESTTEVTALNDRVAELEEEVERVKSSTLKRTEVEKKFSEQSVSDSEVGAITELGNTTSEQTSTALVPEFYRSDLLQVLQEKTHYMTKLLDVEEENEVLKQQLTSILERQNTQPKRRRTISSKESGVRSIMDKTVTLKRDGSSSLPQQ